MKSLDARGASGREGFGLVELVVVVAIIAVLAAIAMPYLQANRQRSIDATLASTLKSARQAMETYFVQHDSYEGAEASLLTKYGYRASHDITLRIVEATPDDFELRACRSGSSSASMIYRLDDGRLVNDDGNC